MFGLRRVMLMMPIAALCACQDKTAPSAPAATGAATGGLPPVDTAHKAPSDPRPVHAPTGDEPQMPPGHPPIGAMNAAADPHGASAGGGEMRTPGGVAFEPKSLLKGVLRVDEKVKKSVKEGDVIYVVVRNAEGGGLTGPPLAVKKLTASAWPLEFQLDSRDAMMTGTQMTGKVVVSVRVDKDGDAMSKNPGDVTGKSRVIELPITDAVVTLDTVM